jgi:hypothetical protein
MRWSSALISRLCPRASASSSLIIAASSALVLGPNMSVCARLFGSSANSGSRHTGVCSTSWKGSSRTSPTMKNMTPYSSGAALRERARVCSGVEYFDQSVDKPGRTSGRSVEPRLTKTFNFGHPSSATSVLRTRLNRLSASGIFSAGHGHVTASASPISTRCSVPDPPPRAISGVAGSDLFHKGSPRCLGLRERLPQPIDLSSAKQRQHYLRVLGLSREPEECTASLPNSALKRSGQTESLDVR